MILKTWCVAFDQGVRVDAGKDYHTLLAVNVDDSVADNKTSNCTQLGEALYKIVFYSISWNAQV